MVFSTHETGGFYFNQDTNKTAWPDTGAIRQQLASNTERPSESSSGTANSETFHVSRLYTDTVASHKALIVLPRQTLIPTAASEEAWS